MAYILSGDWRNMEQQKAASICSVVGDVMTVIAALRKKKESRGEKVKAVAARACVGSKFKSRCLPFVYQKQRLSFHRKLTFFLNFLNFFDFFDF